jgi:chitinase
MRLSIGKLIRSPFQVLVLVAAASGCGGSDHGTVGPLSITCPASIAAWTPGTSYSSGAVVSYNGADYQCIQGHTALDNWTPSAVPALWQQVTCANGGGNPPPPPPPSGGNGGSGGGNSCHATQWQQGTNYHTGDVVMFQGHFYIATHDNPGYDPTISTWFWSPHDCTSTGGAGGSGGAGGKGGEGASSDGDGGNNGTRNGKA